MPRNHAAGCCLLLALLFPPVSQAGLIIVNEPSVVGIAYSDATASQPGSSQDSGPVNLRLPNLVDLGDAAAAYSLAPNPAVSALEQVVASIKPYVSSAGNARFGAGINAFNYVMLDPSSGLSQILLDVTGTWLGGDLQSGAGVYVYDSMGNLVASAVGSAGNSPFSLQFQANAGIIYTIRLAATSFACTTPVPNEGCYGGVIPGVIYSAGVQAYLELDPSVSSNENITLDVSSDDIVGQGSIASPEPASWMTALAGICGIALCLRRRLLKTESPRPAKGL